MSPWPFPLCPTVPHCAPGASAATLHVHHSAPSPLPFQSVTVSFLPPQGLCMCQFCFLSLPSLSLLIPQIQLNTCFSEIPSLSCLTTSDPIICIHSTMYLSFRALTAVAIYTALWSLVPSCTAGFIRKGTGSVFAHHYFSSTELGAWCLEGAQSILAEWIKKCSNVEPENKASLSLMLYVQCSVYRLCCFGSQNDYGSVKATMVGLRNLQILKLNLLMVRI